MQDEIVKLFLKQNDLDIISKSINIDDSIKNVKVLYGKRQKSSLKIAVYIVSIFSFDQLQAVADYIGKKADGSLCLVLCNTDLNLKEYSLYIINQNLIHIAYISKKTHSVVFDFDFYYHQSKYIKELVKFIKNHLGEEIQEKQEKTIRGRFSDENTGD